uniref:Uncharacterized protein n=1 Tax=Anguilla anguilla TaxID=7936 RepID=A0A0E9TQC6_ANGAN
MSIMFMRKLSL